MTCKCGRPDGCPRPCSVERTARMSFGRSRRRAYPKTGRWARCWRRRGVVSDAAAGALALHGASGGLPDAGHPHFVRVTSSLPPTRCSGSRTLSCATSIGSRPRRRLQMVGSSKARGPGRRSTSCWPLSSQHSERARSGRTAWGDGMVGKCAACSRPVQVEVIPGVGRRGAQRRCKVTQRAGAQCCR